MKFFYHISVFLTLHLTLWIFVICISECTHYPLYLYGLWILSAVAVLNSCEALACLAIIGLFEDALFPFDRSFGTITFWSIVTMFTFKTSSWKNTFRYRPRFWSFLLNFLIILEITITKNWSIGNLVGSLKHHLFPTILSMVIVGWLAPHWLKILKKYFI